ncbi:MAG: ATP-dependent DNA helicase RecG [Candidatus Parcubacteria bacterium]|nr:MAG: ATP-dependent DNA helicase RecG [Candidatus Parcubacteria bacterium]
MRLPPRPTPATSRAKPSATLDTPLARLFRLRPKVAQGLKRLNLTTARDLLYHFPSRYEHLCAFKRIGEVQDREEVVVFGVVTNLKVGKTFRTQKPVAEAVVKDGSGSIRARWFHQPYMAKILQEGQVVKLSGVVYGTGAKRYLANPDVEPTTIAPEEVHHSLFSAQEIASEGYLAIYPETKGVSSLWLRTAVRSVLQRVPPSELPDPIPESVRERYRLPDLSRAFRWAHQPRSDKQAHAARKRFAFEEIFSLQIARAYERRQYQSHPSIRVTTDWSAVASFMRDRFPFAPTRAQVRAAREIHADLTSPRPMLRLLEGDVGSGKTAVAAAAIFATVTAPRSGNRYAPLQAAYMAPTEILARQQFASLCELFAHLPLRVGLITSSGAWVFPSKTNPTQPTRVSKPQLVRWVNEGSVGVVVGTHALIETQVQFAELALVVIDEQHRFGTAQRKALARKDAIVPHLLSMSATPIPRTLALTFYGDLDLSILDELPPGRQNPVTKIVTPAKRAQVYQEVRRKLSAGRQAYVICPRITAPDTQNALALQARSVEEEARRLKESVFTEWRIGVLHGKMSAKEKDAVMQDFLAHRIDILVTTTVVEVGVNVPNATVMIIESAERFGLAQLHQLRGRIQRSNHQAFCYCFAESWGAATRKRLAIFAKTADGFSLAQADLILRGAGDLSGARQSGFSDIGMEALKNIKLVSAARKEAYALVAEDPTLSRHPLLAARARAQLARVHYE